MLNFELQNPEGLTLPGTVLKALCGRAQHVRRQGYATLEEAEAAMERGPGQAQSVPSSKTAQLLQKTEEVERARGEVQGWLWQWWQSCSNCR